MTPVSGHSGTGLVSERKTKNPAGIDSGSWPPLATSINNSNKKLVLKKIGFSDLDCILKYSFCIGFGLEKHKAVHLWKRLKSKNPV